MLFIAVWFALPVFSQSEKEQTLLWKITGKDIQGSSYILGTLPVQDSTYFKFPPKLWKYLEQTDIFLYMPEADLTGNAGELRKASFSPLDVDYAVTPNEYLKSIAENQAKPSIKLDSNLGFTAVAAGKNINVHISGIEQNRAQLLDDLSYNYFSGKFQALIPQRQGLDVPAEVYKELISKNNYLLVNDLITRMRLQPVFFPVDVIRMGGNEGLITLLRARGYKLKPVEQKFYIEREQGLLALKAAQGPLPVPSGSVGTADNPTYTTPPQDTYTPPADVKLNLPLDIMNLPEWSSYSIEDSTIQLLLPGKPRLVNENPQQKQYSYSYNGLTYTIGVNNAPAPNPNQLIDQMIIRNGGQLVQESNASLRNLSGKYVELMYLENSVSRHYILPSLSKTFTLGVSGKTPQIFSISASKFFESVTFKGGLTSPIFVENPPTTPDVDQGWFTFQEQKLTAQFPVKPEKIDESLENGSTLTAYSIPSFINGNKYLLAVSEKDAFDNFQLFNSSINTATAQLKAVIIKQDVMPEGKNYFAEYTLKDPIDAHYRITYFYDGKYFYQAIVKGDKKSIRSSDADRFVSGLFLNQFAVQ